MEESNTLERFLDPQNFMYELALTEIRNGRKEEHWIWFIFPQLRGIGRSRMSYHYGIQDIAEAKSYYAHPILGKRLQEATLLLLQQDKDLVEIFKVGNGFNQDEQKMIMSAVTGQAFFIGSSELRAGVKISTGEYIQNLFLEKKSGGDSVESKETS